MEYQFITTQQTGRVLTVWLNNPPQSFLTTGMMQEFISVLKALRKDTSVGAVVLTSAVEGVFLTHFDVAEIKQSAESVPMSLSPTLANLSLKTESAFSHLPGSRALASKTPVMGVVQMNLFHEVMALMRAMDKVFIAAINGRAMGGGHELAQGCDLRVMVEGDAEKDVIGQPEICIGLIPGGGGTQMMARHLGVAKAMEYALDAKLLTPQEALDVGLVHRLAPAASLLEDTQQWAERLARRPAYAVKAIKQAIYHGASQTFDEGMAMEKAGFVSTATQPNTRTAMLAYADAVQAISDRGDMLNLNDMQDWLEGTAFDFHS